MACHKAAISSRLRARFEAPDIAQGVIGEDLETKNGKMSKSLKIETFRPTEKMAENARRGLRLREQFGRGGTEVGVRRARQLIAREELEPADIKSMYSYFARHLVDKQTTRHQWGSETDPSAGYIAWLLWGGDEGQAWVGRQRGKLT